MIKKVSLFLLFSIFINSAYGFMPENYRYELKLMNFNVKGTPVFWYWHFRHKKIGELLSTLKKKGQGAHAIAFQEMMHRKTSHIHKMAGLKFRDRGPKGKGLKINSGLEFISDGEIIVRNQINFNHCSGVDCFARKGVQHVRVKFSHLPFPIDIYNTHLNAGSGKHQFTRYSQVHQMIMFINETRDIEIPIIVLGDFNFRQSDFIYDFLTMSLNLENAAHYCGVMNNCGGEKDPYHLWKNNLIDHQFYSPGISGEINMTPNYYFHHFTDKKVGKIKKIPLSDHPAVMVNYRFDFQ